MKFYRRVGCFWGCSGSQKTCVGFVGLCSFAACRKSRFLVLGAEKKKKPLIGHPPKPILFLGGRNFLGGGRKSHLAAEHHNEAAPKKKKKPRFFLLGAEKYDFRAPKPIFGFGRRKTAVFRSAEKKKPPIGHPLKPIFFGGGAEKTFWGVEKVIWPPNTITRRRRKKKNPEVFLLGRRKIRL